MKTKVFLVVFASMIIGFSLKAQNVAINATGNNPDPSAMLDIQSTTSGLLIPRMTELQRGQISNPVEGLLVYQTNGTTGFWFFDGSSWAQIGGAGGDNLYDADGTLTGNRTVTHDNHDLTFATGTGKVEVNGNFMTSGGALYAKPPRLISASGPISWLADDVTVLLVSGYTGNIVLPSASTNPNRIIGINNRSGAVRLIDNTSGGDTGIYTNENFSQLAATVGMVWFISDGTSWRLYSGRP